MFNPSIHILSLYKKVILLDKVKIVTNAQTNNSELIDESCQNLWIYDIYSMNSI
jgi:hypothetical protein